MPDWYQKTIESYDKSAEALAAYFAGIGARTADIDRALSLAGATNGAAVVEIGCGDGRDASEIIPRVRSYIGIDPSIGLLTIARKKLPGATFVQADGLSFTYPQALDVIYAFASLLHVNKSDLQKVFDKMANAVRPGGIIYLSLKERDEYVEEVKRDDNGERMFYYYTVGLIEELAGTRFTSVYEDHQVIGSTRWFTLALRKV